MKSQWKRKNWILSSFKFLLAMTSNKRNLSDKEDNQFIYRWTMEQAEHKRNGEQNHFFNQNPGKKNKLWEEKMFLFSTFF